MSQMLASQLRILESRLQRREQELNTVIEEYKSNGRLERSRLQAMHDQVRLKPLDVLRDQRNSCTVGTEGKIPTTTENANGIGANN
jgi:ABC-type phosphate transport system auxiliary subunit